MTNKVHFVNSGTDYWPYQLVDDRINDQYIYSNNSYPTAHQEIYFNPGYDQRPNDQPSPNQDLSASYSLLETLLRHGKEAVSQEYVNLAEKPETLPAGQNISRITPPYTPTSSTERTSPIVGFLSDAQERILQPETQNGYFQNYQGYPMQLHCSNCVTPSMMACSSSTNYGVQQSYSGYVNCNNEKQSPNKVNEFANKQAQQQVDYPWMKSYSNGV
jgi:hypothetical protein